MCMDWESRRRSTRCGCASAATTRPWAEKYRHERLSRDHHHRLDQGAGRVASRIGDDGPRLLCSPGGRALCGGQKRPSQLLRLRPGGLCGGEEKLGSADACRSEEHTSELQSRGHLVCRLLLEKKNANPLTPLHFNKKKNTNSK